MRVRSNCKCQKPFFCFMRSSETIERSICPSFWHAYWEFSQIVLRILDRADLRRAYCNLSSAILMAFAWTFSARGRCYMITFVGAALLFHALVGFTLIYIGIKVPNSIAIKLLPTEKKLVNHVFGSLATIGAVIFLVNILGLRFCYNAKSPHKHPKCGYVLILWSLLTIFISLLEIVVAILAPMYAGTLTQQLRNTLHRGLGQYLHDHKWKYILDNMQQLQECCGVERYTDWHRTAWLHAEQLHDDSQTVLQYTEVDGRMLPPAVPWSCCAASALPCFHDQMQQLKSRNVWQEQPQLVLQSISTGGCLHTIIKPLNKGLTWALGILYAAFSLQCTALLVLRYAYTAARNSIIVGDPGGPGYGWLCGRGDFGFACGMSIPELEKAKEELQKLKEEKNMQKNEEKENKTKPKKNKIQKDAT